MKTAFGGGGSTGGEGNFLENTIKQLNDDKEKEKPKTSDQPKIQNKNATGNPEIISGIEAANQHNKTLLGD